MPFVIVNVYLGGHTSITLHACCMGLRKTHMHKAAFSFLAKFETIAFCHVHYQNTKERELEVTSTIWILHGLPTICVDFHHTHYLAIMNAEPTSYERICETPECNSCHGLCTHDTRQLEWCNVYKPSLFAPCIASKACLVSLSQASRCTTILRSSFLLAHSLGHQRNQSGADAAHVETAMALKQMDGLKHFSNHAQERCITEIPALHVSSIKIQQGTLFFEIKTTRLTYSFLPIAHFLPLCKITTI
ncbi:hypothetical protein VNO77_31250 [Canavalia gladiata]|uniref:Uncharacterized protein n=1 Tax=Canavalia gladiata TaxID=3824 RepID=A0AAN9Q7M7_CANGL